MLDFAVYIFAPLGFFWLVSFVFKKALKNRYAPVENYRLKAIGLPFLSYFATFLLMSVMSFIFGRGEAFFNYLSGSTHSFFTVSFFFGFVKPGDLSILLTLVIMISAFCANMLMNLYFGFSIIFPSRAYKRKGGKIVTAILFSVVNNPFIFCFLFPDFEVIFFARLLGA